MSANATAKRPFERGPGQHPTRRKRRRRHEQRRHGETRQILAEQTRQERGRCDHTVARDRLLAQSEEGGARHGQRASCQKRRQHARQANVHEDALRRRAHVAARGPGDKIA